MCEYCGYNGCPETLKCPDCGFDFGICVADPHADPAFCPVCDVEEV